MTLPDLLSAVYNFGLPTTIFVCCLYFLTNRKFDIELAFKDFRLRIRGK